MDGFINLSNFSKIAPYAQLFRQGLLVTVLLSVFTVLIGFVLALVLALMRMSNVRPFRFLAVDGKGHLREGGPLVWISKFNPLSFLANCLCRDSSFNTCSGTDLYYLLWCVWTDRSSIFPVVWIYQIQPFLPGCCSSGNELWSIPL